MLFGRVRSVRTWHLKNDNSQVEAREYTCVPPRLPHKSHGTNKNHLHFFIEISEESINRLSRPKSNKFKNELSGRLSDKAECTFKPKISKAAKELVRRNLIHLRTVYMRLRV